MGSLARLADKEMTPARRRLIAAARDARYTLKGLSEMLGRNPSYLQQYTVKRSPRHLPETIAAALAAILKVDKAELLDQDAAPDPAAAFVAPPAPATIRIPLLKEDDCMDAARSGTVPLRDMLDSAGADAVAILLSRKHGILQPRWVILCDTSQPRLGDMVAATHTDRLDAVGILVPAPGGFAVLEGEHNISPPPGATIRRVLAIRTV